ncbi:thiamine diphosphokinase [uncultured Bifidobacterium sp.]|uniref:thiamine diphosphokinase n=1 Tax=uncultured Bifidobacterium sp. TaxID=165187 RepID=UPI0028DB0E9A|nr:thiamine diphosphokinase [uncultured Bifidobacterium sp.]
MTRMRDASLTPSTSPPASTDRTPAAWAPAPLTPASAEDGARGGPLLCLLFAAGSYPDPLPPLPAADIVIAADGGLDVLRRLGRRADVAVGDFDSLVGARPRDGGPDAARVIALPPQKDDTDMLAALKTGWSLGARVFHVFGGLGGRVDHSLANMQTMALLAAHGGIGFLHGDGQVVTAVADGRLSFPAHACAPRSMVSVLSHTDESRGVSETGLKYGLDGVTMSNVQVRGVSNEFLDRIPAVVEVRHGTLVVTFPEDAPLPSLIPFHAWDGRLGRLDASVSAALRTPGSLA